eukprot:TRINITY_DN3936_c0_g1_i4.p1 TRINITY_DN3936_c0_g1~~TRINITY_DN3936_c0_g1_i4.p1  ORF type:complete len:106 (+),score=9.00 TRINITY_DN3936_c0_g1_i4:60-377(+)
MGFIMRCCLAVLATLTLASALTPLDEHPADPTDSPLRTFQRQFTLLHEHHRQDMAQHLEHISRLQEQLRTAKAACHASAAQPEGSTLGESAKGTPSAVTTSYGTV